MIQLGFISLPVLDYAFGPYFHALMDGLNEGRCGNLIGDYLTFSNSFSSVRPFNVSLSLLTSLSLSLQLYNFFGKQEDIFSDEGQHQYQGIFYIPISYLSLLCCTLRKIYNSSMGEETPLSTLVFQLFLSYQFNMFS